MKVYVVEDKKRQLITSDGVLYVYASKKSAKLYILPGDAIGEYELVRIKKVKK